MALILVVDDELDLNNLVRDQLQAQGHRVVQAFDGGAAVAAVEAEVPDLVILDWMLPDLDGLAVCRRLRENHVMPIIMLTARGEEIDRVMGLEVGADDYVSKPFSMRELLARVRAMLRRVELDDRRRDLDPGSDQEGVIRIRELEVDLGSHSARLGGKPLQLTPKEFDLLHLFVSNPGRAFSREFLLERIWKETFEGYDRAVDAHITRLRRKLGPLSDSLTTVWGVGYRFTEPKP
jgi:DNA-binding response OmpR family regulator